MVRSRGCVLGSGTPVRRLMLVGGLCRTASLLSFGCGLGLMATHRRPPLMAVPPPELLCFDPDEWPAGEWWQSCGLWGRARMAWVKAHPGSPLGTALDVLREKRRLNEAHRRSEWEAGLNGRAS